MRRIRKSLLPVALLALMSAAALTSSAFAGGKGVTTYDPALHAGITSDTIHLYSFRWLVARSPLTIGFAAPPVLKGHGVLREKATGLSACSGLMHHCIRSTRVRFKLTRLVGCPSREVFGLVYSHLYVHPYSETRWHELRHYHEVVRADCQ